MCKYLFIILCVEILFIEVKRKKQYLVLRNWLHKWHTIVLVGWEAIKQIYSAVNIVDEYLIT